MSHLNFEYAGKNEAHRFTLSMSRACPEPDSYTVFYADFDHVQLNRLDGETTPELFDRIVVIVDELREKIMVGDEYHYNYKKLLERQWRFQFTWAEIYGGTFSECENAHFRHVADAALRKIIDADDATSMDKLAALDLFINLHGLMSVTDKPLN